MHLILSQLAIEVINILLPSFLTLLTRPIQLLALGFGSGLVPKAPGTFGTLAAIPFFFLLLLLPAWDYLLTLTVCSALGVYICQVAADQLGVHDHPAIVWDEFVGLWISLIPLVFLGYEWYWLLLGFVLFRFFDIIKPWPISYVDQHVQGGVGIMLDDIIAGAAAGLCLWGAMIWL
jgi:phosphatidylglycerophosphatase A